METTFIRFLFITALIFTTFKVNSQCMSTGDFESPEWSTHGSGNWTETTSEGTWEANSAYVNTGSVHGGSNKFGMNSSGDYLITPQYTDPATLQFWVRTSSDPDNWVLEIQTSTSNTGPWTTQHTVTENGAGGLITNSYTQISANLNLTGDYYIRFYIRSRSAGSIYIDDITLTCGSACVTADDVISPSTSAGINQVTINWTAPLCFEEFMIVAVENSSVSVTPSGDGSSYISNSTFGNGTDLGTNEYDVYEGVSTSATVTGLNAGTSYCFMIFTRTGTTWNSGIEVCATPIDASGVSYINGILVNACSADGTKEGLDELVTIQVGDSDLDWDDIMIDFPNGGQFCNSGCPNSWTTNSSYVSSDLDPDCGNDPNFIYELGVDGNVAPAGSRIIVFTSTAQVYDFDFSTLCGTGPIYVMFANSTAQTGRFANNASGDRSTTYNFAGYNSSVTYFSGAQTNTDGDFVKFDISGNAVYLNNCTPDEIIILSNDAFHLNVYKENNSSVLKWKSNSFSKKFVIERSIDGKNYFEIGNTSEFEFVDANPNEINYYRIIAYGEIGKTYSNIEKVDFENKNIVENIYPNPAQEYLMIDLAKEGDFQLTLYAIDGKEIIKETISNTYRLELSGVQKGIYFLNVSNSADKYFTKVVVK